MSVSRHPPRRSVRALLTHTALISDAGNDLNQIIIVGNTVMHLLFCGVNIAPLPGHPFEPQQPGRFRFYARELGWNLPEKTVVEFLPCIGGFVGSDILAGIVATGLHESRELMALMRSEESRVGTEW